MRVESSLKEAEFCTEHGMFSPAGAGLLAVAVLFAAVLGADGCGDKGAPLL